MSLREKVLSQTLRTQIIEVPEWREKIGIRELTVEQRLNFSIAFQKSGIKALIELMIDSTFDPETGKPAFEKADRDTLAKLPGKGVQFVTDAIFDLSAMTATAQADIEKNSEASAD